MGGLVCGYPSLSSCLDDSIVILMRYLFLPPGCDFCWRWQRATPSYRQLFRQWWDTLSPYYENQGSVAGDEVLCCCFACWNIAPDVELFFGMAACTGAPKRLYKSDVLAYSQVKTSLHRQGNWFCGHLRTTIPIVMDYCQRHDDSKQLCFFHAIFLLHHQYGRLRVSSLVMSMVTC